MPATEQMVYNSSMKERKKCLAGATLAASLLFILAALPFTGCRTAAPGTLQCTSEGAPCYDARGAEKTCVYDLETTTKAGQLTLRRMGFKMSEQPKDERGERRIRAAADKTTVTVALKKITPRSTKMRVEASDSAGAADIATALEIIYQTEKTAALLTKR